MSLHGALWHLTLSSSTAVCTRCWLVNTSRCLKWCVSTLNIVNFYPLNSPKNQNFKKKKRKMPGDIIILHKCTKNHDHMQYCSWDMVHDRCNCYFSFWAIFAKFQKNEKNIWRYHHFTYVYQKLWSDDIWFLRYGAQ